jgi:hypothetical protein
VPVAIEPAAFATALDGFLSGRPAFTRFCRNPRVGFAAAADPRWEQLRTVAHPDHLRPTDLLPGARSVVGWFLPFQPWLVEGNRGGAWASAEWAEAACPARRAGAAGRATPSQVC